jgi:hypothetical protein
MKVSLPPRRVRRQAQGRGRGDFPDLLVAGARGQGLMCPRTASLPGPVPTAYLSPHGDQ